MRPFLLIALAPLLLACEPGTSSEPAGEPLPLMGGYRDPADQCVRVGENAFTNQFLDDAADFVGCPEDYEGVGVFETETGARLVAVEQEYRLYSVPVR
ncbi:hypothetical protein [Tropicimonas isoalkanivorans]|uniref:Uncharacterized protein n=1 Tax=Tropicimonas isoalkanivorans TaxID=441112 RepID=A0A1I1Q2X0_9RHOB|nr:hypothetical protein [Tropicimonas isoalkanivorans]SFD12490.1 hypothetical protein SAMN04488094_11613 [Tropicimonas isoalkanivorans]